MSAPKSELQPIANALERLVDILSASPKVEPATADLVGHSPSVAPLPGRAPSLTALDDALTPYHDHLRPSKGPDGRPWYYWHYTQDKAIWIAVNDIFKRFGYVWVSDKKNSHWEPKEAPP